MRDRSTLRWWVGCFASLLVSFGCSSSLVPPMTGADETSHLIRLAAVGQGELTGSRLPANDGWVYEVEVPSGFDGRLQVAANCLLDSLVDARCIGELPPRGPLTITNTPYGNYPPLYYVLVSPATMRGSIELDGHLARLGTVVLVAAYLASAFAVARRRRWAWASCGLLLATTQAVVLATTTVNPNALEIAAAALLWVALPAFVLGGGRRVDAVAVAVAGSTLALARPSSLLWLLAIAVATVVFCGLRPTLAAARSAVGLVTAAVVGVSSAVAFAWYLWAEYDAAFGWSSPLGAPVRALDLTTSEQLSRSIGNTLERSRQLLFGYGDVNTPTARWPAVVVAVLLAVLIALAVRCSRPVRAALVLALVVAVPVVTTGLEVRYLELLGDWFQPRYVMPLAIGVPIVAGLAIDERGDRWSTGTRFLEPVRRALAWGAAAMLVASSWLFLRRFAVGVHGPVLDIFGEDAWHPPLPGLLLLGGIALGRAALTWAVLRGPDAVDPPLTSG